MVFFRTLALECDRRGIRSVNIEIAREGVIMCGSVISGSEIVGMEEDEMSCHLE